MKSIDEDSSALKHVAPPQPGPALVVARWNSWVRVWFPDTGDLAWINLDEHPFGKLSDSPDEANGSKRAQGFEA